MSPDEATRARPLAAMSIDVEDWFHDANLGAVTPPSTWADQDLRVERSMDRMLELMDDRNVRATCFVLGWVADQLPGLVRRIADAGHEVASHGYGHDSIYDLSEVEFRSDVERSKGLLEGMSGQEVRGYRAPNFSLTDWALPILADVGYQYDSSLFPTSIPHDRYGKPGRLKPGGDAVSRWGGIAEVSMSCLSLGRLELPWAGGGYFRLLPYPVFKLGVDRILRTGRHFVFYIHPWEIDSAQPRVRGLKRSERFRHYLNLERAESRWTSLLRDFRWVTIADLLSESQEGTAAGARETSGTLAEV